MRVVPGYEWLDGIVYNSKLIGSQIGETFPEHQCSKTSPHFRDRRDQRAVLLRFTGCGSALSPLSTTPAALLKTRARHELAWCSTATAAGFRLRLGGGTLRSGCDLLCAPLCPPLHFPRSPTADRSLESKLNVGFRISLLLSQKLGSFCDSAE